MPTSAEDLRQSEIATIEQLANAGEAESQLALGLLYMHGSSVPRDYVRAERWFRAAAEQGLAEAQYNLAFFWEFHDMRTLREFPRDSNGLTMQDVINLLTEGLRDRHGQQYLQRNFWMEAAASQGYSEALFRLALDHLRARYGRQDPTVAMELLVAAARQNHADAQGFIGYLYFEGLGVSRSHERALMWYMIRIANGSTVGERRVVLLRRHLSPEVVSEIERLANVCIESRFATCEF